MKIDYKEHFRVAVFGSARIKKSKPAYKTVHSLAKMIAAEGIDIITGGGPGLMEAANKGHKEGRKDKNIHSYGLNIKLPKEQDSNRHLDIKKDFEKFSERLDSFMELSNVVVVAPGGIGTALELFYAWQLIQVKHVCEIPIILIGGMWEDLIKWIKKWPLKKKLMSPQDMKNIFIVKTPLEAMKIIKKAHDAHKTGVHVCKNIEQYRVN